MQPDIAQIHPERKSGQKKHCIRNAPSDRTGKSSPQRCYLPSVGIAVPDQKLQLMGHQNLQLPDLVAGPPSKAPLAQPFLTKPKPLRVIRQYFDGRASLVAKNKEITREGVRLQNLPAYPGQTIDTPAKVYRLDCQPDLHLRSHLDHRPCLQKARLSSTGSNSLETPLIDILIVAPFGASISTRHSEGTIGAPRSSFTKPRSGRCSTA